MVDFLEKDIIKKSITFYNSLNPFFKVSIIIISFSIVFLFGYKVGEPTGKFIYYISH